MKGKVCGVVLCLGVMVGGAGAQRTEDTYSRKNTFTLFTEYSNDSSHIFLGVSRSRKLADAGIAYARRIFIFKGMSLQYLAEVRPVTFESDPVQHFTNVYTFTPPGTSTPTTSTVVVTSVSYEACKTSSGTVVLPPVPGIPPESYTYNNTCGRQWTFTEEFTPLGLRYSLRTSHRIQPFLASTAGYMYSNRPVPTPNAGSFNFQFDFGAGVEIFRSRTRSISVETRLHHFSNKYTADANPGVDNINYKISYSFGR